MIVVTHEADIGAYADRMIVMRDGQVRVGRAAGCRGHAGRSGARRRPRPRQAHAFPKPLAGFRMAFLSMIFFASLQALARNKLRSALTMLGVFIGVAALIAMVAVGDGASAAVQKQLESLGTNMVVVQPGATTAGGIRAGAGSASTLTVTDADDDPARRSRRHAGRLSRPSGRTGRIRQPELEHEHSGRDARLSGHRQLAHRRGRNDDGVRKQFRRARLPDRPDRLSEPLSVRRKSRSARSS